jgi:hypothetical protein
MRPRADWSRARQFKQVLENVVARDGVEPPTPAFSALNGPNHLFNQQLNSSRWPIYCDRSVTSADVRLSVGPNLSRAACQRPVDFRQSQEWTGGPSERKSALTSGCPLCGRKPRSPRNEFRFAGGIGDHFHPRAATIWYVFRVGQHKKERASG